jgi:cytochrome c oxidase subunit 2
MASGIPSTACAPGPSPSAERRANLIIVGGGAVMPTVRAGGTLLIFGLALLPGLVAPAPAGSLTIVGRRRVVVVACPLSATSDGQTPSLLANEIHLPVGETVEFQLESDNVIHSFWIPALGGKVDMLPGRANPPGADANSDRASFAGSARNTAVTSHTL